MEKILVIDDDQNTLDFVKKILTGCKHKYRVITSQTINEGLDLIQILKFHLILTDIKLSKWSGFDFVQSLKKNKRFKETPIIMISSLNQKKDIEKALKVGADDYIIKPFNDVSIILKKIEKILSKKTPQQDVLHIDFNKMSPTMENQVKILLDGKIIKLYEDGMELLSSYSLRENELIKISHSLFSKIGLKDEITLRVFDNEYLKEKDQWKVYCCFYGLSPSWLQKISSWIYLKKNK